MIAPEQSLPESFHENIYGTWTIGASIYGRILCAFGAMSALPVNGAGIVSYSIEMRFRSGFASGAGRAQFQKHGGDARGVERRGEWTSTRRRMIPIRGSNNWGASAPFNLHRSRVGQNADLTELPCSPERHNHRVLPTTSQESSD